MGNQYELIGRAISGEHLDEHAPRIAASWGSLLNSMRQLCSDRSPAATELLRRVASFPGPLRLGDFRHAPHMVTPLETLHSLAVTELALRGGGDHIDVLAMHAFRPGGGHSRAVAASHFHRVIGGAGKGSQGTLTPGSPPLPPPRWGGRPPMV